LLVQSARREYGLRYEARVTQPGELHQPDAVGEGAVQVGGGAERESGLADATDAGEGEKAGSLQELLDFGELGSTSDEAGDVCGKVADMPAGERCLH
jgi:hypothetical protein